MALLVTNDSNGEKSNNASQSLFSMDSMSSTMMRKGRIAAREVVSLKTSFPVEFHLTASF